jgi:hypothetical protein
MKIVPGEVEPAGRIAVNGEPIKARGFQLGVWTVIGIILGPALIAGAYYAFWQMHWTFGFTGISWSLKHWWDLGTFWPRWIGHWVLYRHLAFRDLLEPATATMVVKTFLANSKTWKLRAGPARLILTPPALLAAAIALGSAGVWVLYFGAPDAWHWVFTQLGHPHYRMEAGPLQDFLAHSDWEVLAWGIGMGLVLHWFWAPVGATIQGFYVDRGVDRLQVAAKAHRRVRFPLWVVYPIAPVQIRERFSWLWDRNVAVKQRDPVSKGLIWVVTAVVILLTLLGLLARYWFSKGHYMPYLNPRP